jgi:hypothetical protein
MSGICSAHQGHEPGCPRCTALPAVVLDKDEMLIALDAVMVFFKAAESVPGNDGSELPAVEALQRKLEAALG